jgi:hypothetical protein
MNFTIRVKGLDKVQAALDPVILAQPARNLLTRSGDKVKSKARDNAPYFNGHLRDSIAFAVEPSFFPKSVEIGSNLVYARATELGRPAGKMPPSGPLEAWAQRKGMGPGAGYAIALKIMREGTEPRPYLLPAVRDSEAAIQKYVTVFGQEIVAEAVKRGGG